MAGAIADYRESVRQKPDFHKGWFDLAMALAPTDRAGSAAAFEHAFQTASLEQRDGVRAARVQLLGDDPWPQTGTDQENRDLDQLHALVSAGQHQAAVDLIERMQARNGMSFDLSFCRACSLAQLGRCDEAVEEFSRYADSPQISEADRAELIGMRAEANRRGGHLDAALADAKRKLELMPGDFQVHGTIGCVAYERGQWADAERELSIAISASPATMLLVTRAETWRQLGEYPKVAQDFRNALQRQPDRVEALIGVARILAMYGEAPTALQLVAAAQRLQQHPSILAIGAYVKNCAGDAAGADADIASALRQDDGKLPEVYFCRATIRVDRGDFAGALADFDVTLLRAPIYLDAQRRRAFVLSKLGRNADAKAAYEKVLTDAPGDLTTRINYATVLSLLGDVPGALAQIDQVLAVNATDMDALVARATILINAGRADEAFRMLAEATARHPESAAVWSVRLTTLANAERLADAWECGQAAKRALRNMPGELWYDLACVAGTVVNAHDAGNPPADVPDRQTALDTGLDALDRAVAAGFPDAAAHLDHDADFDGLRRDARFRAIRARAR